MNNKNLGVFTSVSRIIALGDIHADYEALIFALKISIPIFASSGVIYIW